MMTPTPRFEQARQLPVITSTVRIDLTEAAPYGHQRYKIWHNLGGLPRGSLIRLCVNDRIPECGAIDMLADCAEQASLHIDIEGQADAVAQWLSELRAAIHIRIVRGSRGDER